MGKAYYMERNRLARMELEELKAKRKTESESFDQILRAVGRNPLGAGIEAMGILTGSVCVAKQVARTGGIGVQGRQLYPLCQPRHVPNPWEFVKAADRGPERAKELLREGLGFIHKSIEVNPEAISAVKCGRPSPWNSLLAAIEDARLLLKIRHGWQSLGSSHRSSGLRAFQFGGMGTAREC